MLEGPVCAPQTLHSQPVRPLLTAPTVVSSLVRTVARCKLDQVTPSGLDLERQRCELARDGDREALAALLREYGPRLYRSVLLPRLGSKAAAEEALSQTYVKVIERIRQFTWQNVGFYPWLRTMGLHVAIDQIRRRRRETLFEPGDLMRELDRKSEGEQEPDALDQYDRDECRRHVESLLLSIHPRYAQAIRLRVLEERSREAVATELGVSVATFDVVLHRAMGALKKVLAARGAPVS